MGSYLQLTVAKWKVVSCWLFVASCTKQSRAAGDKAKAINSKSRDRRLHKIKYTNEIETCLIG
ncbi:unnamed protein product, partial [Ceratitis capitata]